jgi:hypothetical protein
MSAHGRMHVEERAVSVEYVPRVHGSSFETRQDKASADCNPRWPQQKSVYAG